MHEMALASDIVDAVLDAAKEADAKEVKAIYLTIGEGRDVVTDLFEGLVHHLAKDTIAADADLVLWRSPLLMRCDDCGMRYPVDPFAKTEAVCPSCKAKSRTLYSGLEFRIDKIEVA